MFVIGLTAFGESFVFLSLLFPGTAILIAAGTLVSEGILSPLPTVIAGIAGAAEAIGISKIYAESSAGPEVGSINGVVDDYVPPVQTPLLGAFRLLAGLSDDACDILDDLMRTDRALDRTGARDGESTGQRRASR